MPELIPTEQQRRNHVYGLRRSVARKNHYDGCCMCGLTIWRSQVYYRRFGRMGEAMHARILRTCLNCEAAWQQRHGAGAGMATNISAEFYRELCDRADDAALEPPTAFWARKYAEDVNALLAERKTLRGMLERWLEAAVGGHARRLEGRGRRQRSIPICAICGMSEEEGHTPDCPVPYTRALLQEKV